MIVNKVKENIFLILILSFAFFLRIYKMPELMAFGGDVARDFLAARDITLRGDMPLVGSPSSVPWLYQGALFTYILGVVLWLGKYNPLAGGYFVGIVGIVGVLGIYLLGKKLFNKRTGLASAFFYASSPLIIIFDRYPYHQSLISIFMIAFIYCLFLSSKNPKYFNLSFFIFGLLMQLELSNLVVLPILLIWLLINRKKLSLKLILTSFLLFVLTWLPKIIYDVNNGYTQTLGLIAWIIHKLPIVSRIIGEPGANLSLVNCFRSIFLYLSRIIFWPNILISTLIFIILSTVLLKKTNFKKENLLVLLWVFVPILGFLAMGNPSESYMPVLFGGIALLFGSGIFGFSDKRLRILFLCLIFVLGVINSFILINHNFFVKTSFKDEAYNYGFSYDLNREIAGFLVNSINGEKFNLIGLGNYGQYNSSTLNTKYLCWYFGNEPSEEKQNLKYYIYEKKDNIIVKKAKFIKDFNYIMTAGVETK